MRTLKIISIVMASILLAACSGGSGNSSKIKGSVYYENVVTLWDTLSSSTKSQVCASISGPEDKTGKEIARNLMKIGLKFDMKVDITQNESKYDEAIDLFVSEKCS